MKRVLATLITMLVMALCGYGGAASVSNGQAAYRHISSDKAQKLMETESGYIILDVRTQQEYEEGHIPKAICLPNESIGKEPPSLLPDKGQEIFVYCWSGRRSKEAAQKLADMCYTNIVEFGGIIDWHGEVVKD